MDIATLLGILGAGAASSVLVETAAPTGWQSKVRFLVAATAGLAAPAVSTFAGMPVEGADPLSTAIFSFTASQTWHHVLAKNTALGDIETFINQRFHGVKAGG